MSLKLIINIYMSLDNKISSKKIKDEDKILLDINGIEDYVNVLLS